MLAEDYFDEYDEEEDSTVAEENTEMGVLQMLKRHREDGDEAEKYFETGYEEEY